MKRISLRLANYLESEASRIKSYYGKINNNHRFLEEIAFKEFNVVRIGRSRAGTSHVYKFGKSNDYYLSYGTVFKPALCLWFGHELGHIAIKNSGIHTSNKETAADYFSMHLNDMNPSKYLLFSEIEFNLHRLMYGWLNLLPTISRARFTLKHATIKDIDNYSFEERNAKYHSPSLNLPRISFL